MLSKTILLCFVFSCFSFIALKAQESVNSSGADASSNSGTVACSIGEVFYTSVSGNNNILTQGIQQSYSISTLSTPRVNDKSSVSVKIFPNPTTTSLTIHVTDFSNQYMSYRLFNLQGQLIKNGTITSLFTELSTANLSLGTYMLNIKDAQHKMYSYKIIKK